MNVVFALVIALLGFTSLPALAQSGRTFYIDYSSGSNSNQGTQAAPWKTHPYMQAAAACTGTGSAPSYSHQAGDHFIFKGGVTWPASCFSMVVMAGGTASASDYYGACYTGGSVCSTPWPATGWKRPLFDMQQQVPSGNMVIAAGNYSLANYVVFDNLEIANQNIKFNGTGYGFGPGCGLEFSHYNTGAY